MGVDLMGDLPFVVAGDSADVWSRRREFRIDMRAGTPPDAFSPTGQDWGLPVYDWQAMEESDFAWMRARARRSGELYGIYRVDHVIGLYRTFFRGAGGVSGFTPEGESAQIRLGEILFRLFSESGEIVAEDLGMVPEYLRPSLTRLGIPGYRVLRWEKDERHDGDRPQIAYRDPASWPELSVATSGTHDIESTAEWYDALPTAEREALLRLPALASLVDHPAFDDHVRDAILRQLYAAPSRLVAVPIQDALGTRERINVPGTVSPANWTFRMPMDAATLLADRTTSTRLERLAFETGRPVTREA
jgi:4-alpha-glucanotransferase